MEKSSLNLVNCDICRLVESGEGKSYLWIFFCFVGIVSSGRIFRLWLNEVFVFRVVLGVRWVD